VSYFLKSLHQVHHARVVVVLHLALQVMLVLQAVVDISCKHVVSLLVLHEIAYITLRLSMGVFFGMWVPRVSHSLSVQ
jgi:hypothetical protein